MILEKSGLTAATWTRPSFGLATPFVAQQASGRCQSTRCCATSTLWATRERRAPSGSTSWVATCSSTSRGTSSCPSSPHHDLAPWNLVLGDYRWVFIDWDNAGPGSRLWDLAYAAHGFIPLAPDTPSTSAVRRVAELADGYRLDERGRSDLADLLVPRIMSMYDLLDEGHRSGAQPWARLWSAGHGRIWLANAEYARRHHGELREALTHST